MNNDTGKVDTCQQVQNARRDVDNRQTPSSNATGTNGARTAAG
jgi:hypothetical protein